MPSSVSIYTTKRFRLVSHGNGWAYTFRRGIHSIWLQDVDALTFRTELEALESARPELESDLVLLEMWNRYQQLAS